VVARNWLFSDHAADFGWVKSEKGKKLGNRVEVHQAGGPQSFGGKKLAVEWGGKSLKQPHSKQKKENKGEDRGGLGGGGGGVREEM